jgi:phosphoribosylglycinamide formyltransferase-1
MRNKTNIAIFASGGGSNAKKIIECFAPSSKTNISLIVCNKPNAGVLQIAKQYNIPSLLINKESFYNSNDCLQQLQQQNIHFIVLAGFLWKMPASLTSSYQKKIINIHPALLPKYGGKGMYGHYVHEAVIANNETQTGITIHYVDEIYDNGEIIFQATCPVSPTDTAQTLATKVHALEHLHYAPTIASVLPNHR